MLYPGYVYKNKKTQKQFIPLNCGLDNEGNIHTSGYYLVDKKDDDVILTEASIYIKKKELEDWEKTYEYFKHS